MSTPNFVVRTVAFGLSDVGNSASPTFVDIDGDGDLDALISNRQGESTLFLNAGTSTAPAFVAPGYGLTDIGAAIKPALVDIDGDGDLDAFVGEQGGATRFFLNTGNASAPAFALQSGNFGVLDVGYDANPGFVDLDGDGDLDAVVGERYGTVGVFYNVGTATAPDFRLSPAQASFGLPDLGYNASPEFADIDGDGDLDAFVGEIYGNTRFFLNTGTVSAPAYQSQGDNLGIGQVASFARPELVDFDGDGKLDAVLSDSFGVATFFRNTGTVSAPAFTLLSEKFGLVDFDGRPNAVIRLVDIDHDGDLDAFRGNDHGATTFYRNEGSATAPAFVTQSDNFGLTELGYTAAPSFVDIDADGDLDAFIGENSGATTFFRNTGTDSAPAFVSQADNFGLVNLLGTDQAFIGPNGNGVLDSRKDYQGFDAVPGFADVDGDGDFDAFIGERNGTTVFFRNVGTPSAPQFQPPALGFRDVGYFASPVFFDVDADGDEDALLGSGEGLKFFLNTGSASLPLFASQGDTLGLSANARVNPTFVDINHDGKVDVFVGKADGTTDFFLNTGSASAPAFELQGSNLGLADAGNGAVPSFIDVDGDGDLDALIGNDNGTFLQMTNVGTNTAPAFQAPNFGLGNLYLRQPAFVDIDGDADLDVFVGNGDGTTSVFLNSGSATAPDYVPQAGSLGLTGVGSAARIGLVDINGDGALDALISAYNNGARSGTFFRNTGTATAPAFQPPALGLENVGNRATPSLVDLDGDGDLDVVLGNQAGEAKVYLNTGSAVSPAYALQSGDFGLAQVSLSTKATFGDLDDDNDLDALVSDFDGNTRFYLNTGTVSAPAYSLQSDNLGVGNVGTSASPFLADIDGDGDLDAFIGNYAGETTLFLNTGSASAPAFASQSANFGLSDVGTYASPSFVDIDGDNDLDALIGNFAGTTSVFLNIGDSTAANFLPLTDSLGLPSVNQLASPTFTDLDGDGDPDALIGNGNGETFVFRNTGGISAPAFQALNFGLGLKPVEAPGLVDIDDDGDLDAFAGNVDGTTSFFLNTGSASAPGFALQSGNFGLSDVGDSASPAFIDIDGDGDLDAFVGNSDGVRTLFLNTGTASAPAFLAPAFGVSGTESRANPTVADIDGDGDDDVFVGSLDGLTIFYRNAGTASAPAFASQADNFGLDAAGTHTSPDFVDIDGDGDLDAFVGRSYLAPAFFRNTGSATAPDFLSPSLGITDVGSIASPAFGDLDGDGDLDALVGNNEGITSFFLNSGGTTTPSFVLQGDNLGLGDIGTSASPSLVDIDGDNDLDVFIGNLNGDTLFFRNTGSVTAPAFSSESNLGLGNVGRYARPAFVDIDGDGDLDAFIGERYGSTLFYRNTGSATAPGFASEAGNFGIGNFSKNVAPSFTDIDGDGDLDAFVGTRYGETRFFRNTGSETAPAFTSESGNFGIPRGFNGDNVLPSFADIDGDGDVDALQGDRRGLFTVNYNLGSATAPSFQNASFGLPYTPNSNSDQRPDFVDIDADGDRDVFIGTFEGETLFFRNVGTTTQPSFASESGSFGLVDVGAAAKPSFVDIDDDGDLDAFIGESEGTTLFFRNTGSASAPAFASASSNFGLTDVGYSAVPTFSDLDGDGDLDALVGEESRFVVYFENTGTATAPAFQRPGIGLDPGPVKSTNFIDIDGDGDLDAFIGQYDGTTTFIENTAGEAAPNQAPVPGAPVVLTITDTRFDDAFATLSGVVPVTDPDGNPLTFSVGAGTNNGDGTVSIDTPYGVLTLNSSTGAYAFVPDDAAIEALDAVDQVVVPIAVGDGTVEVGQSITINFAQDGTTETAGNDTLLGTAGNDAFNGLAGNDTFEGLAGNDVFDGGGDVDTVTYASADSAITASLAVAGAQATGGAGSDTFLNIENLFGSAFNDVLTGNGLANELRGGNGNDTLNGGAGADKLIGGAGNDTYFIDVAGDLVTEANAGGTDTVVSKLASYTLGANVENGRIDVATNLNLTGNTLANTLTGGAGKNVLAGGAGADKLTGGTGADRFDFNLLTDSGVATTARDSILDFSHAQLDKIDLAGLDANTGKAGDQAFSKLVSSNTAFSATKSFTAAGQLYYDQKADVLYGNTDADAAPEFSIKVVGTSLVSLVTGDFIL